jgi:hypothetical protein
MSPALGPPAAPPSGRGVFSVRATCVAIVLCAFSFAVAYAAGSFALFGEACVFFVVFVTFGAVGFASFPVVLTFGVFACRDRF